MTVVKETQLDTNESVVDTPDVVATSSDNVANSSDVVATPAAEENSVEDPLPPVPPVSAQPKAPVTLDIESKAIVETFVDAIEGDFDLNSVMELVPRLMKHVQTYGKLTGPQKKKLVIKMINHIIDITDTPYVDDATWDPIMKQLVPKLIDTLVEVNNGKLVLKKRKCALLRIFLPSCCSRPSATVE